MAETKKDLVLILIERGVRIPHPESVAIAEDVSVERIAPNATIHPGCRITGAETAIGPGSEVGKEAPATIIDCQLGENVQLKGGYFENATFMDGSSMGSCAHVRGGTLLEEQASGAHSVGLKQTVLLPFATLGSLINFCDCLMAGGTSRRDHSEVGSSYVHFNFTPHGDKATPSLVGDVPRGILLDQKAIFLGGQGGLVGPARIEFGAVIPAGAIWRKDALEGGCLHYPADKLKPGTRPYCLDLYRGINRILKNNLIYIGNIFALKCWYTHVRSSGANSANRQHCIRGAIEKLDSILDERVKRLDQLAGKMNLSLELASKDPTIDDTETIYLQQRVFEERWPEIRDDLESIRAASALSADAELVVEYWEENAESSDYTQQVKSLPPEIKRTAVRWLQTIVDRFAALSGDIFPT